MPLTAADMLTTPYKAPIAPMGAPTLVGADHYIYDWTTMRATLAYQQLPAFTNVGVQGDPNGDTIYLPFEDNKITSMVLPTAATANGVTAFITAAMSGCKFFVDEVVGTGALVVSHANVKAHSPPGTMGAMNPMFETPAATAELTRLHNLVITDYAAAPRNRVLAPRAAMGKPRYNLQAEVLVTRKRSQGRKSVEFGGGTCVAGFLGAHWEFYVQTWGDAEYDRPWYAPKRYEAAGAFPFVKDNKHRGVADFDIEVLECLRFYP